jgi:hypothetical protein
VTRIGALDPATAAVDAAAAEVLTAFDENGVDALLLKGRALGALLYEGGERTGYADVDLLVAPPHLSSAEHVLAGLGYSVDEANRWIDDIGGIAHARSWVRTDRGPLDQRIVDLHWKMPGSCASPTIAWEALTAQRTWIDVGGHRAATLDRGGQALHLAIHAAQHGPGFARTLDELSLALARWPVEVWASAAALAQRVEATPAFAAGLRLLPEGAELASRLELPPTAQLDWTIRNRGGQPRGTLRLQALLELDSLSDRLELARRSLLPPQAWIIHEFRWARAGSPLIVAAYAFHWLRLPLWAARGWRHRLRARRAARTR